MSTVSRTRATAVGATAVLMWGVLALFTTLSGDVPPFLLTAIAFSIGGLLMICKWVIRGENIAAHLHQPLGAWVLGVVGLFGYHFLYFLALKSAPPVQAGLIAYLWPLLIVMFSALLPGEKLRWFHVIGAISGLVGTVVLVSGSAGLELKRSEYFGYFLALACAFTWSGYSVLNRRFGTVPTDTVGAFCVVVAVLSFIAHLVFEETIMPANMIEWLAVIGLGLFPGRFGIFCMGLRNKAWRYPSFGCNFICRTFNLNHCVNSIRNGYVDLERVLELCVHHWRRCHQFKRAVFDDLTPKSIPLTQI
jgi:drug/metabolite transporter (DMT)-like permease